MPLEKDFEVLIASFIENKVGISDHFLSANLASHLSLCFADAFTVGTGSVRICWREYHHGLRRVLETCKKLSAHLLTRSYCEKLSAAAVCLFKEHFMADYRISKSRTVEQSSLIGRTSNGFFVFCFLFIYKKNKNIVYGVWSVECGVWSHHIYCYHVFSVGHLKKCLTLHVPQ